MCIQGRIVTLEEKERLQSSKANGVSSQGIEHDLVLSVYMYPVYVIHVVISVVYWSSTYMYVYAGLHLDIMQREVQ